MGDNDHHVTAIPENGKIYISADYGVTWAAVAGPTENWVSIYVSPSGQNQIAGTNRNGVYISTDHGANWSHALTTGVTQLIWKCVTIDDIGNCIAGGNDIIFYRTTDLFNNLESMDISYTNADAVVSSDVTITSNNQTIAHSKGLLVTNNLWQSYRDVSFDLCKSVSMSSFAGELQILVTGAGANEVRITNNYWQTNRIIYTMLTGGSQPPNGKTISFAAISGNGKYIMIAEYPETAPLYDNTEPYQLRSAYMKESPSISAWPTIVGTLTCGQTLQSATLVDGLSTTPGKFIFAEPMRIPPNGTSQHEILFVPNDSDSYSTVSRSITVTMYCRPCDDDRGKPNLYGADHESVRVRKRIDACACCRGGYGGAPPTVIEPCTLCDITTSSQPPPNHAHSEHHRMMRELTACPLYEKTYTLDIVCDGIVRQNPYVRYEYRTYDRITGIEEVADTVRGISSSEITTRRRRTQEVSAQRSQGRHAEHFRVTPPAPPCRPPQVGPQPGVPIAPVTPCNPGTQRVDYSIPNK